MIITGAPVEKWLLKRSTIGRKFQKLWIGLKECDIRATYMLGAQVALYHHYGIGKVELSAKCSGVYSHVITDLTVDLVRGFSDLFTAPHSRYTSVSIDEVRNHPDLRLLSYSEDAGVFIVQSKDNKNIMITGHLEYDATTLADEYSRDVAKGIDIAVPVNYFPNDDPTQVPMNTWRPYASIIL